MERYYRSGRATATRVVLPSKGSTNFIVDKDPDVYDDVTTKVLEPALRQTWMSTTHRYGYIISDGYMIAWREMFYENDSDGWAYRSMGQKFDYGHNPVGTNLLLHTVSDFQPCIA